MIKMISRKKTKDLFGFCILIVVGAIFASDTSAEGAGIKKVDVGSGKCRGHDEATGEHETRNEGLDWTCHLYNSFRVGVEGASVGDIENNSIFRFQYDSYVTYSLAHLFGGFSQTGSGEFTRVGQDCESATNPDECEIGRALNGHVGAFVPVGRGSCSICEQKTRFGLSSEFQTSKVVAGEDFKDAYYGGIRFVQQKNRYFDISYGKIDGISGGRLRFKGQLADKGDSLAMGIEVNIAADNDARENGEPSSDTFKIYLLKRLDLDVIASVLKTDGE